MKRYWIGMGIWGAGLAFVGWRSCWDWQLVSAIATWFLVLGVAYAFLQVQQARRSTNAQIAMGLFKELRSQSIVEHIRSIYRLKTEVPGNLQDNEKYDIDYVLDRFDTLGGLVVKGIIDKELAIETYGGTTALRCWFKLKDYIIAERDKRGYYSDYYETFVRLCLDHFRKEHILVKFYIEGEENKRIDLVMELQQESLRPRTLEEIKNDRQRK